MTNATFATIAAGKFVVGSTGAAWTLPVATLVAEDGTLTNRAWNAITEVADMGTILGITARAPHNKKENQEEATHIAQVLNTMVDAHKAAKKNEEDEDQMVEIEAGVNISADAILSAMEDKGLRIGGECETKGGFGIIKGYKVTTKEGIMAIVDVDGIDKMFFCKDVWMVEDESALAHQAAGMNMATDEDSDLDAEVAKLAAEAKVSVETFVLPDGDLELTATEKFEAQEAERHAKRAAFMANRAKQASAVAGSAEAQELLDLAKNLLPAKKQAAARPQTTVQTPAQNQNQTHGGNVQMTNNNRGAQTQTRGAQQDRPTRGTGTGAAPARANAARTNHTQASQTAGGRSNMTHTSARANTGAAPSRGTTIGAAPANAARKVLGLKKDAMVSIERGAWYMSETAFPEVVSGSKFEETRANRELGITDAKMYTAEDYAARFNREARENDIAVLEIFFGKVSFEFQIKASVRENAQSPWYCANITFVENRRGNGGAWKYSVSRKMDAVNIAVTAEGKIREATASEVENNQHIVVGGTSWKNNETVFGISMGEDVIAQVMRWTRYGWETANGTQA